jgi:glycosyltransferase involved in cell wall biosynthesis
MHRVLLISTSYPKDDNDWAGRFIKDMVDALSRKKNIDLHVWCPPGKFPDNVTYAATDNEARWLSQLADRGGIAHLLRNKPVLATSSILRLLYYLRQVYRRYRNADLLHINWLHNAIPLGNQSQPALVTVLGTDFGLLKQKSITGLIKSTLSNRPCIVSPNAEWMASELTQKLGRVAKIHPVPFGIEKSWFDLKREIKPGQARKWLVVLRLTHTKIGPLFDWGKHITQHGDELHLFGPMQEKIHIPEWVHYHGATYPEALQQEWYPRASGLITLSQHDEGRPQVILEAMASGIPVIASDQAAHTDILSNGKTGYLINTESDFSHALDSLRDMNKNLAIGLAARSMVKENIGTWDDCADRYLSLYESLINKTA